MQTYGIHYLGRIRGPVNAETVLRVPESRWVITSCLDDPEEHRGVLTAVHIDDHEIVTVHPDRTESVSDEPKFDGSLLRPGQGKLSSHGMAIKRRPGGRHRLYVVNHNVADRPDRQSVEVFDVEVADGPPRLRHLGGVLLPPKRWPTDVVALPGNEEGFITNSLMDPTDDTGFAKLAAGAAMGELLAWTPAEGWSLQPGGPFPAPNGLEISLDGRYLYIGCWSIREIWRIERGVAHPRPLRCHANGVLVDNLTWSRDGNLLCAGQLTDPVSHLQQFTSSARCNIPSSVLTIDPRTLAVQTLASGWAPEGWGLASCAVEVDDEIWVGSARADGILRFTRNTRPYRPLIHSQ